jgi:uncharacterized protein (DUF1015 family)
MIVKPFAGLRPIPEKAAEVASPPYDVLDSNEARERTRGNPNSFLHVTKPEIDLDPTISQYDDRVYQRGAENLQRFIRSGLLVQDEKPCFYIYKLQMGDHIQVGLVAATGVEDYLNRRIKEHESTRPDKEQDRVNHIDRTNAHTGPVFLMYKDRPGIGALIAQGMLGRAVYDFISDYGIRHTLYVVDDDFLISKLESEFGKLEALYVADGHHRSAAAARVREMRRLRNPGHTGEEGYNYFLSVIFPDNQMRILEYNRAVVDMNGYSGMQFFNKIEEHFSITPFDKDGGAYRPDSQHTFGMYLERKWYRVEARSGSFNAGHPVEGLDVSILQSNLLAPVLDIFDPKTDPRINFVGGIRGLAELERIVNSGEHVVAFSMFPTRIEQLMAVADAGLMMPPKSTWFEPKLESGLVIHLLD